MTEVIILRHAETEVGDILKGSLDTGITDLSEYGMLTTMVTARAIRDYYRDVPHFYFAHCHYKRTKQTGEIVEKVVPTEHSSKTDSYHLATDIIYRQELLGAEPIEIEGLRERNFGSLEGQKLNTLAELVKETTPYPNLTDFLLYGTSEDFANLAKRMGVKDPEWGEGYKDIFKRAYAVSKILLKNIGTIDNPKEKSVIVVTTHRIFGNYFINALLHSIAAYHFPEELRGKRRYSRHLLFDYDLEPCRFARLEIMMREDNDKKQKKPYSIIKEINDRGHLVCIETMPNEEREELINEAKSILQGSS